MKDCTVTAGLELFPTISAPSLSGLTPELSRAAKRRRLGRVKRRLPLRRHRRSASRAMIGLRLNQRRGEVSMATITLGIDLSKQLFSTCMLDGSGCVMQRREMRRDAFAAWLAQCPAGAIVDRK